MCMEDFKLGNNIRAITKTVTVEAAESQLLLPDPARVGVLFGNGSGVAVTISIEQEATQQVGFDLSRNNPQVYFSMATHGDLTTREFRVFNAFGPIEILVVEFFLPLKAFQVPLESLGSGEQWRNTGHRSKEQTSHGSKQQQR